MEAGEVVSEAEGYKLHLSSRSQTGYLGVQRNGRHFRAVHVQHNIGTFVTKVEAAVAYARYVQSLGGDAEAEEEEEEEEEEDDDDNSERAAALDAREAALIEREMALALREAEVAKREAALAEGEKALAEQRRQLSLLGAEEAPVTPTLIWEAAMAREQGKERARMEAAALRNAARADSTSRREAARQAQLGY